MDARNEFQELINITLETANNQNHKIEVEKVKEIFADLKLSDAQFSQIYSYLVENKIEVIDEESTFDNTYSFKSKKINSQDAIYLVHYFEELKLINECTIEEEIELLQQLKKGNNSARARFIEINLQRVAEIAGEYKNRGMTAEDLIQEGNIALMQSLDELTEFDNPTKVKEFIDKYVSKSLYEALKQQQENDDFENRVVEKSDRILHALKELEEMLGERADIHLLADYMKISEDEIIKTLELTGDVLEIKG